MSSSSLFAGGGGGGALAQRQWGRIKKTNSQHSPRPHTDRRHPRVKRTNAPSKSATATPNVNHVTTTCSAIKRGVQERYDGAGRTVLITGANSGIGLEASKQLVAAGCTVVMACRTAEKAEIAVAEVAAYAKDKGGGTTVGRAKPAVLDLASLASVRAFAHDYIESGAPLHVLVCNAVSLLAGGGVSPTA